MTTQQNLTYHEFLRTREIPKLSRGRRKEELYREAEAMYGVITGYPVADPICEAPVTRLHRLPYRDDIFNLDAEHALVRVWQYEISKDAASLIATGFVLVTLRPYYLQLTPVAEHHTENDE